LTAPNDALPPSLTIVLGMHRSGTSLCSHVLSLLGIDMADEVTPSDSNAKGHWERWEIVELHDQVFRHFGQDYYGPRHALPLPPGWWAEPAIRSIRDKITAWIRTRMGNSRRFGLKDPRICRLLPMWREILLDLAVEPRFVVCFREPTAVARSLEARDKLNAAEGMLRWLAYTADLVNGLGETPVTLLPYDRWFSDFDANLAVLSRLVRYPGQVDPRVTAAIRAAVDPTLRHQGEHEPAQGPAAEFYRLLAGSVETGRFSHDLRLSAASFDGFAHLSQPWREEVLRLRGVDADLQAVTAEAARLSDALRASQDRLAEMDARRAAEWDMRERRIAAEISDQADPRPQIPPNDSLSVKTKKVAPTPVNGEAGSMGRRRRSAGPPRAGVKP
jgi:hypothetical protein